MIVHLDTSLELQIRRTEKDKKRPLLQDADHEEVLTRLKEQRDPIYKSIADISYFVGEESSKKVVAGIMRQLRESSLIDV